MPRYLFGTTKTVVVWRSNQYASVLLAAHYTVDAATVADIGRLTRVRKIQSVGRGEHNEMWFLIELVKGDDIHDRKKGVKDIKDWFEKHRKDVVFFAPSFGL